MPVNSLKLINFRNFETLSIDLSPGVNFFVGDNGQGKTNIAEAIYFISVGRSFRTGILSKLLRIGEQEGSVFIENQEGSQGIIIRNGKKEFYRNSEKVSDLKTYFGGISCVVFSPSDIELIRGGATERRKFLDKLLIDTAPDVYDILSRYQSAYRNKSELLKKGQQQVATIMPWSQLMVSYGERLTKARQELADKLGPKISKYYQLFSGKPEEQVVLKLSSSWQERLSENQEAFYTREITRERVLIGAHQDDISITLQNQSAKYFASQGQMRSIALALKCASADLIKEATSKDPTIVLDDIESELDLSRREKIIKYACELKSQLLVTATGLQQNMLKQFPEVNMFYVENGHVRSTYQ